MMAKMMTKLAAAIAMLWCLPLMANAQTFEDNFYTYEVTSASTVKIIGFSKKFNDITDNGEIYLEKYGSQYTDPTYDGVTYKINEVGELAFSPDNPFYNTWPAGKELCQKIATFKITYSNIVKIGDKAFMNCSSLSEIALSISSWPIKPIEFIGEHCFDGTNLYSVYWNDDIKTIPAYCFANTPNLQYFYFRDIQAIGEGAFQNSGFENMEFPSTLENIESKAFKGCQSLKGFRCNDESPSDIAEDAFEGIPSDAVLIVPMETEDLYKACKGWNVFGNRIQSFSMVGKTVSDEYFTYEIYQDDEEGVNGLCTITGLAPDCTTSIFWGYQIYGSVNVTDMTGANHSYIATNIAERAFRNETNISRMDLSNTNIEGIDDKAFSGCTNLFYIDLPKELRHIGTSAFEGCTQLTTVVIPESVNDIGSRAFAASGVNNICTNSTINYIPKECYAECPNLTDVEIPAITSWIGEGAFSESSIQSLTLNPLIGNNIFDFAFADCKQLKRVIAQNDNPGNISTNVFKGVAEGAALFVPEGSYNNYKDWPGWTTYLTLKELTDMTDETFEVGDFKYMVFSFVGKGDAVNRKLILMGAAKGKNPTEVAIPATIEYDAMDYVLWSVNDEAFQNNGNITRIDFSASANLQDIGEYAFSGCANLKEALIPASVWMICEGAFMGSGIEETDLNNVTYLEAKAFKDCKKLKRVSLPHSVAEVGPECFMGTTALEEVNLPYVSSLWLFDRAFAGSGIKKLFIPYCIDTDQWTDEVFKDCSNLKDVVSDITDPKGLASGDIFSGIAAGATLWVPEGTVDTYQGLDGWKDFFANIREHVTVSAAIEGIQYGPRHDEGIYDLQGRRIGNANSQFLDSSTAKGIYIMGGKKFVVK